MIDDVQPVGNRGFSSARPINDYLSPAGEIFANREKALLWLQSPNPDLEGRTPLAAAQTEQGYQAVEDILVRIGHGVLG